MDIGKLPASGSLGGLSDVSGVRRNHMIIDKKDLVISYFRSSGPGGQKKNKTETAVRIHHLPTGIVVTATESRSRTINLVTAFERLHARLKALNRRPAKRIPTRIPAAVRDRRLAKKKRRAEIKRRRRKEDFPGE
jgi:ribosome-associated protein